MTWNELVTKDVQEKTASALEKNGFKTQLVANGEEAKKKVLELLPQGAEVMTMTSVTLDTIGISKEVNESGNYDAVWPKLMKMDRKTQGLEMQKLGAAPEWVIGSVHAVTEDGHVLIASRTGSQLPAYAYGSAHVIWVIGAQKIVKDTEQGMKRIYEHSLPLESERSRKAYGVEGSKVNKILIMNADEAPNRATIIFVNEVLGF